MAGPLSHIRVLDLSRVLAGPWCGQNLADLGAEVIKIERPKAGDDSRAFGPPWLKDASGSDTRESAYFASANRGKKSVTVNLSKTAGHVIICSKAVAQALGYPQVLSNLGEKPVAGHSAQEVYGWNPAVLATA